MTDDECQTPTSEWLMSVGCRPWPWYPNRVTFPFGHTDNQRWLEWNGHVWHLMIDGTAHACVVSRHQFRCLCEGFGYQPVP